MEKIRVGILGFGMAGQVFHAPVLAAVPNFVFTHAYTQNQSNQSFLSKHYPEVEVLDQLDPFIHHPDIDLIIIATSNEVHFSLAKQAIDAGKHVVVEKPFTINTQEADDLIQLAKQKGVVLSVHHNARWNNDFLTIQKLLQSEQLGEIVRFEARYDRFRPSRKPEAWRERNIPGSGILYDLGAHLIDQALQLFGWPQQVYAYQDILRTDVEATDDFMIILYYPSLKAILRGSVLALASPFRYHINGTLGSFTKGGIDPQEELLKQGHKPHLHAHWGVENEKFAGLLSMFSEGGTVVQKPITSEAGHYPAFYEGLAQAILHKQTPPVTARQARDVIYIIERCLQSQKEQKVIPCQKGCAY